MYCRSGAGRAFISGKEAGKVMFGQAHLYRENQRSKKIFENGKRIRAREQVNAG